MLVTKDAQGGVTVQETGDHLGRRTTKVGAGAGLAVGLFAPPLLAATAIGAAAGGLVGKLGGPKSVKAAPSADQRAIERVRACPDQSAVTSANVVGYAMPAAHPGI